MAFPTGLFFTLLTTVALCQFSFFLFLFYSLQFVVPHTAGDKDSKEENHCEEPNQNSKEVSFLLPSLPSLPSNVSEVGLTTNLPPPFFFTIRLWILETELLQSLGPSQSLHRERGLQPERPPPAPRRSQSLLQRHQRRHQRRRRRGQRACLLRRRGQGRLMERRNRSLEDQLECFNLLHSLGMLRKVEKTERQSVGQDRISEASVICK